MQNTYPVNNFYQILIQNTAKEKARIALYDGEIKVSNLELLQKVDTVASFLNKIGIKRGDKVAMVMSNSAEFIINLLAISKIGAVAVPVNNFLKHDELAYIINDSGAKLLFASAKFEAEVRGLTIATGIGQVVWVGGSPLENEKNIDYAKITATRVNTAEDVKAGVDDLAVIIYTSGTTGKPKGAMLSYRNLFAIIYGAVAHYKLKDGKAKFICYLPMFHAFTLTVTVILPIYTNSAVIVIRSIGTKKDFKYLLKQLLLHRCRYFTGVPDV